jgi:hypothetical protein
MVTIRPIHLCNWRTSSLKHNILDDSQLEVVKIKHLKHCPHVILHNILDSEDTTTDSFLLL